MGLMAGGRGLPAMGCKSVYGLALSKVETPGHPGHPPPLSAAVVNSMVPARLFFFLQ